jgi:hypothetical protein
MESLDDGSKSKGFIKHVFNFDDDSKSEMMNIIQYALLAIIPVVGLNKTMQKFVPEADENKSSLEISAEIVVQVIVIFIGLFFVHRLITFVPTYSGINYPEFSIIFIILAVLMITMSLQTKLGEKVSIIVDRLNDLWEGKSRDDKKKQKNGSGNVRVSQPISGQMSSSSYTMNQMAISPPTTTSSMLPSYNDGTSISQLPTNYTQGQGQMKPEQLPNYNNMFQKDPTPLIGAATPGFGESFEPMAANSVLGGGGFGAW